MAQEHLGLNIDAVYFSKWECQQWPRWVQWGTDKLRLPGSHLRPSRKSLEAKQLPSNNPRLCADEFSTSTPMALGLLGRWAVTLKESHQQSHAEAMLHELLGPVFAGHDCTWAVDPKAAFAQEALAKPPPQAIQVAIHHGDAILDPLFRADSLAAKVVPKTAWKPATPLGNNVTSLPCLIVGLVKEGSTHSLALLHSLLVWAGLQLELHMAKVGADRDPLSLPILRGHKRARRVTNPFRMAVSREAALGLLGKSGRGVVMVVQRFKRFLGKLDPGSANKWARLHASQYLCKVQRCLQAQPPLLVHLSTDATRLGGKEQLWTACHSDSLQLACWAPPKVRVGLDW